MAELDEKTKAEIEAIAALAPPGNVIAFNQAPASAANSVFNRPTRRSAFGATDQPSPGQMGASTANGSPPHTPTPSNVPIPGVFDADELLAQPAPQRRWCVDSWIPKGENTLCAGDGGQGKTTIGLQLTVASTTGCLWLGLSVERCKALYVSAEDPIGEIHYRLEQIKRQLNVTEVRGLKIMDLAGQDATLARFKQNGQIEPTPLFRHIEQVASEHKAGLIVLDAVADFFGGNENDRGEVRSFIGMLRGLAIRLDAAILIIAHPSVDGIRSGRGYSGSTHWNNAVRSRLTFTTPTDEQGKDEDTDRRVLELAKANRARRGQKIELRWWEGCFVVLQPGVTSTANDQFAEDVFLRALEKTTAVGQRVTNVKCQTYAPTVFVKMWPFAKDLGKDALDRAMNRLIAKGRVQIVTEGSASRQRSSLVVSSPAVTAGPQA
jgi:RecA-family ATPase